MWDRGAVRSFGVRLAGDAIDERDERGDRIVGGTLLLLLNANEQSMSFTVPALPPGCFWEECIDSANGRHLPLRLFRGAKLSLDGRSTLVRDPAPRTKRRRQSDRLRRGRRLPRPTARRRECLRRRAPCDRRCRPMTGPAPCRRRTGAAAGGRRAVPGQADDGRAGGGDGRRVRGRPRLPGGAAARPARRGARVAPQSRRTCPGARRRWRPPATTGGRRRFIGGHARLVRVHRRGVGRSVRLVARGTVRRSSRPARTWPASCSKGAWLVRQAAAAGAACRRRGRSAAGPGRRWPTGWSARALLIEGPDDMRPEVAAALADSLTGAMSAHADRATPRATTGCS